MAGEIYCATGTDFTDVQLSKLARGAPHRDPVQRDRGVREYPLPAGCEAIVRFLTDPASKGFILPREELEAEAPMPVPHSLVAFFAQSESFGPSATALIGTFIMNRATPLGEQQSRLSVEDTSCPGLLACALSDAVKEVHTVPHFNGWAVLSPDGHLLIVLHHRMRRENRLLTALGATPSLLGNEPVDSLTLELHLPCGNENADTKAPPWSPVTLRYQRSGKKNVAHATKAG